MKIKLPLSEFSDNVYSQNGEDGIVRELLGRLREHAELDKWCVEFGAWDGVYLSNTSRLIRVEGYSGVLIEGDRSKFEALTQNFPQENVHNLCKFIHFEGQNSLDNVLSGTPIPLDFDFLSIDIDGCDFHIFDSLKKYHPKIVCVEFNQSIPNCVDYVQPRNFSVKHGSSARALMRLAQEKGYRLVAVAHCNLILVREDLAEFVVEGEQSLEFLNPPGNDPTYLFSGQDGTLLSNKDGIRMPWLEITHPISKLQVLPRHLRIFPGDYGKIRWILFRLWRKGPLPKRALMGILRRIAPVKRALINILRRIAPAKRS